MYQWSLMFHAHSLELQCRSLISAFLDNGAEFLEWFAHPLPLPLGLDSSLRASVRHNGRGIGSCLPWYLPVLQLILALDSLNSLTSGQYTFSRCVYHRSVALRCFSTCSIRWLGYIVVTLDCAWGFLFTDPYAWWELLTLLWSYFLIEISPILRTYTVGVVIEDVKRFFRETIQRQNLRFGWSNSSLIHLISTTSSSNS